MSAEVTNNQHFFVNLTPSFADLILSSVKFLLTQPVNSLVTPYTSLYVSKEKKNSNKNKSSIICVMIEKKVLF